MSLETFGNPPNLFVSVNNSQSMGIPSSFPLNKVKSLVKKDVNIHVSVSLVSLLTGFLPRFLVPELRTLYQLRNPARGSIFILDSFCNRYFSFLTQSDSLEADWMEFCIFLKRSRRLRNNFAKKELC